MPKGEDGDEIYISPWMKIAPPVLTDMLPKGGAPIYMDQPRDFGRSHRYSELEHSIAAAKLDDEPPSAAEAGVVRSSLLEQLSRLPDTDDSLPDGVVRGIIQSAVHSYHSALSLKNSSPSATVLWNEELDPRVFIARTLLLADHVVVPDKLFGLVLSGASCAVVRARAIEETQIRPLYRSGRVLAVPIGVAAAAVEAATSAIDDDIQNQNLRNFVRSQLVIEGPTAREALIVNARDDLDINSAFWLYARIDNAEKNAADGNFVATMLGSYESDFDYSNWVEQVTREAVGKYIRRTTRRLAAASLVGAEYVSASPFESRLLRARSETGVVGAAASAVWAGVPTFANLHSKDLVKVLEQESAVEDLRARVRQAVSGAVAIGDGADSVAQLSAEIENASKGLERKISRDRLLEVAAPLVLGTAGVLVAATGGVSGVLGGAISGVAGLIPAIKSLVETREQAPYLYVMARKREHKSFQRAGRR